jgi:hypothetical protein
MKSLDTNEGNLLSCSERLHKIYLEYTHSHTHTHTHTHTHIYTYTHTYKYMFVDVCTVEFLSSSTHRTRQIPDYQVSTHFDLSFYM